MKKIHNWTSGKFWKQWSVMAGSVLVVLEAFQSAEPILRSSGAPGVAGMVESPAFNTVSLAVAMSVLVLRNLRQGG